MSRLGFHFDRSIDVADDDVIRIASLEFADGLDRATFDQTAAGVFVGHDDHAGGVQNLGRFRHEPDAAERDDVAIGLARFAGEFEAIANDVGQFLNLGVLIVVSEQDSTAVAFEVENFFGDGCRRGNHNGRIIIGGAGGNPILSTVL